MSAHNCDHRTILKMKNRFDYEEYKQVCAECGCIPDSVANYAAMCGVLSVAEMMMPGMPPELAYIRFQGQPVEPIIVDTSSKGLGDTIAKMTTALGIKPCSGCKERQAILNDLVPYKVK